MLNKGGDTYPNEAVEEWASWFKEADIGRDPEFLGTGSGPYQFQDWQGGKQIVLQRTPNYWGAGKSGDSHMAGPDEIHYSFVQGTELQLQLEQQT